MSPLPTSRTVVNPASSTLRAYTVDSIAFSGTSRRKSSTKPCFQSSVDSPVRWVCASMKPGESVASPRSMTSAPAGMERSVPTARIFGPCTRTTPLAWSASALPSNSRAAFTAMTGGAFALDSWAGAGGVAIRTAAIRAAGIDSCGFMEVLSGSETQWNARRHCTEARPDAGLVPLLAIPGGEI